MLPLPPRPQANLGQSDQFMGVTVKHCKSSSQEKKKNKQGDRNHSLANQKDKNIKMSADLQVTYRSLSLSFFFFFIKIPPSSEDIHNQYGCNFFSGFQNMAQRATPHGLLCQSISVLRFSLLLFPSSLPLLDGHGTFKELDLLLAKFLSCRKTQNKCTCLSPLQPLPYLCDAFVAVASPLQWMFPSLPIQIAESLLNSTCLCLCVCFAVWFPFQTKTSVQYVSWHCPHSETNKCQRRTENQNPQQELALLLK